MSREVRDAFAAQTVSAERFSVTLCAFQKLCEAATDLHEQVEMDESVGICLSDRTASLNLGRVLAELDRGC